MAMTTHVLVMRYSKLKQLLNQSLPMVSTGVDAVGELQLQNIMSHKPVTTAQTECLRKMANDKKLSRAAFQAALDNGAFGRFLDQLKADETTEYVPMSDARIAELTELAAKQGARIHILRRVKVKQDRDWQEAVNLAGPNTPSDYNVRKVGDQYLPTSTKMVEKDIVLLNYSKGDGNWDKALTWGDDAKLKKTVPREAFAIGEQHPALHTTLGQNPMYVVATTKCVFGGNPRACYVWWLVSKRVADLFWVSCFGGSCVWFSFCE